MKEREKIVYDNTNDKLIERLFYWVQDGLYQMILAEDIGEKEEKCYETVITIHSLLSI